jgi:predicted dehydrogenase
MKPIRLITLAPGHFHAALVQKEMQAEIHPRCYVYGPLDADTLAHLERLTAFNSRDESPTQWQVDLRGGQDWLERFVREQPGNTVVLSGRNRGKMDLLMTSVTNGLNVLADKPWIIEPADFPRLEDMYREAELREIIVRDVMTERHEITNRILRELVRDPEIFGAWQAGTPRHPALVIESVHHLRKTVAGRPLRRPWWWFVPAISGHSIADVGTHLADLALWLVAPNHPVDYRTDIQMMDAEMWPLVVSDDQFREVTGLEEYPAELKTQTANGQLYYPGNSSTRFTLHGVEVRLTTQWEYEAEAGGDIHHTTASGTRARIQVRQRPGTPPGLYLTALGGIEHASLLNLLTRKCQTWNDQFPSLTVEDGGSEIHIAIPAELRSGHEAHFAAVLREYVRDFYNPRAIPSWERPNTLAKYFITTKAVELARQIRAERAGPHSSV